MKAAHTAISAVLALVFSLIAITAANAQITPTFKLIYYFGTTPGAPHSLTETSPGVFVATSAPNNSGPGGTVFQIDTAGNYKVIYQFPQFYWVDGGLQVVNGQFFGWGHSSTGNPNDQYLSLLLDGSAPTIYPLSVLGGTYPYVPAIPSPDGFYHLLGTSDGTNLLATLVKVDLHGNINTVHAFDPNTEGQPNDSSNFVRGQDGSFYGITTIFPNSALAQIFKIDPTGHYTTLTTFPSTWLFAPRSPINSALVITSSGIIYGSLPGGGTDARGAIFKYLPGGQMTTLYNFVKGSGIVDPNAIIMGDDGNLYGAASYGGLGANHSGPVLYGFNLTTNAFQPLYSMNATTEGSCTCQLLQGSDGKIYGGAQNNGSFFSLDIGLSPPKPKVSLFWPTSGSSGQQVLLWGRNLLGVKAVAFNGVPALTFNTTSSNSINATVPPGANSGPITITTPNGTFTTTSSFQVP